MAAHLPFTCLTRQLRRSCGRSYYVKTVAAAGLNTSRIHRFSSRSLLYQQKFTKEHEWVRIDSDGNTGTIGISTYAANALGDVVYVELPKPDAVVHAGDTIGAVESVKSASDIMTPLSGKILEVNSSLEEKPSTINKSPETDGWIAKMKVENTSELDELMSEQQYKTFLEETS